MRNKNIGIIGSGTVGQTLGNGFIKNGYKVMIGTRDDAKLADWKKQAINAYNLFWYIFSQSSFLFVKNILTYEIKSGHIE